MVKGRNLRQKIIDLGMIPVTLLGAVFSITLSLLITHTILWITDSETLLIIYIIAAVAPAIISPMLTGFFYSLLLRIHSLEKKTREMARRDSLTGLLNHRAFFEQGEVHFELFLMENRPMSVVYVDIDHFKIINDRYGHAVGDRVLRKLGKLLNQMKRGSDVIGRIGGEEFAVLLPDTGRNGAAIFAEKLRKNTEEMVLQIDDQEIRMTLSAGISSTEGHRQDGLDTLTGQADKALYQAKGQGRNCCVLYAP